MIRPTIAVTIAPDTPPPTSCPTQASGQPRPPSGSEADLKCLSPKKGPDGLVRPLTQGGLATAVGELTALPQQTGEHRAAPAAPAHHATSHEKAHQLALIASAPVIVIVLLVVIIVVLVPALAHEIGP